ncbi:MAG: lactate utilization protein [Paenibacillus sp.]|nr:lactate utilization protein [Paenibacillus sp.]
MTDGRAPLAAAKAGSIKGKDGFIGHLAKQLGRKAPLTAPPARTVTGVPEFYASVSPSQQEQIELFTRSWTALTGKVWVVSAAEAAEAIPAILRQVCADLQIDRVTRWEHPDLQALPLDSSLAEAGITIVPWRADGADPASALSGGGQAAADGGTTPPSRWSARSPLLQAAEQCRLGVVWADYALANTGTLVLKAHGGRGRSVSLLPEALFAVFSADRLVTRMGEALELIQADYPDSTQLPSSINLITGPSRSADIENDLTIGIHGPGKVFAVIVQS